MGFYGGYRSILVEGYGDGIWRLYHYSKGPWVVLCVICRIIACIYMDIELSIEVSRLSGRILPVHGCDNRDPLGT